MARSGAQALKHATSKMTTNYNNLCLKYVRVAFNVAAKYPSAISAWNNAQYRHRSLANAPTGAPVFFSHPKSKYGHVALLTEDKKHIRTTNSALGRPATQPISLWTEQYGYTLLGWTEDLNGVRVVRPVEPKAASKPPAKAPAPAKGYYARGHQGAGVRELQRVLNSWYPRLQPLKVDGIYGPATEARVRYFQQRARLKVDGVAGKNTLARLGLTWRG